MISEINPSARSDRFGRKINRDHSPLLAWGVPLLTMMLASLAPMLPIIAAAPIVPPLSFMFLLAWQVVRPGLLPMWVGLPLGAFDDLFSGQPFGCAIMLWSLAMLMFDIIEARFPWRGFWQEWLAVSGALAVYLVIGALLAGGGINPMHAFLVGPQLAVSVLLFPLLARIVAALDRVRLLRVRVIS